MPYRTPAATVALLIVILLALLLPALSLIAFGGLYIWEKGWALYWAISALVLVASAALLQRAVLPPRRPTPSGLPLSGETAASECRDLLSPAEQQAWSDVQAIAAAADVSQLLSFDDLNRLALKTVEAVAARVHPERKDAVWQFTVPEALAIIERVSRRLAVFTETRIPFGDRLTVAQAISLYRWRNAISIAERAYDIWRLVRLANPATAATNEMRDKLTRAMLTWGQEHVGRRLVQVYVQEIGRAAIDLYAGRLSPAAAGTGTPAATDPDDPPRVETGPVPVPSEETPLPIVVIGASDNRRAVVDAIERGAVVRRAETGTSTVGPISESSAISKRGVGRRQLVRDVREAGVLVWVVDPVAGPMPADLEGLALIQKYFATRPILLLPPLMIVVVGSPILTDASRDAIQSAFGQASFGRAEAEGDARKPDSPAPLISIGDKIATRAEDSALLLAALDELAAAARRSLALKARNDARRKRGTFGAVWQAISAAGNLSSAVLRGQSDRQKK